MRNINLQFSVILLSVFSLSACSKSYTLNTEPVSAVFRTPKDVFEMELLANETASLYKGKKEYRGFRILPAFDGNYEIVFSPSPSRYDGGYIKLLSTPAINNNSTIISVENSFYQINQGVKKQLNIQGPNQNRRKNHPNHHTKFVITEPKELEHYDIDENGDGIISPERYKDELEKQLYRYYVLFLIDGVKYELDVSFRFDVGTNYEIGFPTIVP